MTLTKKFGVGFGVGLEIEDFDPMDFPVRTFVKMDAIHDAAESLRSLLDFDRLFAQQVNGP